MSQIWRKQIAPDSVTTPSATYYSYFVSDGSTATLSPGTPTTVAGREYKLDSSRAVTEYLSGVTSFGGQTGVITVDNSTLEMNSSQARVKDKGVTNAKLADVSTSIIKGRLTAGAGSPEDLTATQAKLVLAIVPGDVTGFDTQVRSSRLEQMASPLADVSLNSHKLIGVSDGVSSNDAATVGQMTAAIEGRKTKDPAQWGCIGNITLSGLGTQANGEWTGTLNAGDRIFVNLQSSSPNDGIYVAAAGAWVRSADANIGTEITLASVLILNGATLSGDTYTQSATVTTIGSDPQTWVQTGEGAVYSADNSTLELIGTQFREKDGGTTNIKLAVMAANTVKINATAGSASPTDLALVANQIYGRSSAGNIAAKTVSDAGFSLLAAADAAAETALLNAATQSLKGLLSAADKAGLDHSKVSFVNILDYGGDNTATSDNATAIASAMAALPATGGVVYFPFGSYLLGSNISVTKTIIFRGDNAAQSIIVLTSPTADGFTLANWNSGFDSLEIAGLATNSTGPTTGSETTLPVTELKNFPNSGSFSYGGTAGWVTITYTGKSASSGAGNLTGCSALPTASTGANVMIRTGGYAISIPAVTSSGGNYNFVNNCKIYSVYDGIFFASALGYIDTVEIRNVRDSAVVVDGNNDKFINRLTTASSPIMATSVKVNLTSSLLLQQCQVLQGAIGLDLNALNGITIPSIEAINTFFDNNTIGMRVTSTGTGSIYRSKFSNCWFSSGSTAGVQFNTTQFDGFSFSNCDFYGNGKGISAVSGGGHWTAVGCFFAQNTTAIDLAASAGHFPQIFNCEFGPRAAFGANTLGINIAAGTYKGCKIENNILANNTTNMTVGAVTVTSGEESFYSILNNAGYNPLTNANVTTPTFPATTVVVKNTTGRRVLVYCKSGSTAPTVITLNGVANSTILPAVTSLFTLLLEPGGTIAFTFTVALTWQWTAAN